MTISPLAGDRELIAVARGGEPEAIGVLVQRYSPRLHRFLLRLLREPTLAEDILQETWLHVVERLDRYDAAQPIAAWLFAVAHHCAIDALRQRARLKNHLGERTDVRDGPEGEPLDPLERVADGAPSSLDTLAEADLCARVARVFDHLPRHYREVLSLRFEQELPLKEIARALRLPLSTVKTRVQRGLALLRKRVEGLGLSSP
jgi:RNA polymerase sigma-70 factor (ECF subfamily)